MTKIYFSISDEKPTKKPCPCDGEFCERIGRQYADISVPVELKPKTRIGKIEAKCCGEPSVDCYDDGCMNECRVVITQKICVNIPIRYELNVRTGESTIECCGGELTE